MISKQSDQYPVPEEEEERLATLYRYDLLDTPPEDDFDRITSLARRILNVPVCLISLVDRDREWHKSAAGTEPVENPRDESFCAHAITRDDPLIVPDAREDERFRDYPLVTGESSIKLEQSGHDIQLRAYAGVPLQVDNGKALGTLCVVDHQPRSFTEEEIRTLQDLAMEVVSKLDLRLKNKQFEQLKDEAEQANRAKSTFLARMSHDIRTPLNSISGVSDLLSESDLSPEQQEYVTILKHASEMLLNLINDILDFSKIEAGELELTEQVFYLDEFIDKSVSCLSRQAYDKGVELVLDVDSDCPARLVGDPRRLQQIVVNLVGNAIKFTEEGEVVLRVRPDDAADDRTTLVWEIVDSGPGIPEEDQQEIFRSYRQSRAEMTQDSGGTGLGLAISKHLVQKMGGEIGLESEPGVGSVFRCHIPFAVPDQQQETETILARFQQESRTVNLHEKRALVVDDHRISRRIFRSILEEWGATVETAADGPEALEKLEEQAEEKAFDLIILDRNLPDANGFDIVEQMKQRDLLHKVVIMVTSDDLKGDLQRAREYGIQDYLLKPINRKRLLATIEAHLRDEQQERIDPERSGVEVNAREGAKPHVLIAEDNQFIRRMLDTFLEDQPVNVEFAENGRQAVSSFRSNGVDLLFLDLRMPEMDGLEATRIIRDLDRGRSGDQTPIVMLSGDGVEERKRECLEAGCNEFVMKPVNQKKILELIQHYTGDQ
jgi:signal transduction histidine kinase/CheY-like chemotaxis protein